MRSDIAPGGTFPDYELPDHENLSRKLSEMQGDDPLILTLARGHYCVGEASGRRARRAAIRAGALRCKNGAQMVAPICVEPTNATDQGQAAEWAG